MDQEQTKEQSDFVSMVKVFWNAFDYMQQT